MKVVKRTYRLKNFFKKEIWEMELENLTKAKARFVKYCKVAIITIKTFSSQKIGFQAVALSFYSALAAVPLLAIMFALTGWLGLEGVIKELIYSTFDSSQQTVDTLLGFSENVINNAQQSATGLLSSIFFCMVVINLMLNVEKVFNNVWRVSARRRILKRLSYVLITILLSPFIVILFFYGSIFYADIFSYLGLSHEYWGVLRTILSWVLFASLTALVFCAMYKFIPNSHVSFGSALRAAIPAAIAFTTVQYLYLETQVLVTNMNTIYGAFAAVPLLLIWLNIGWFIILMGAEISYAFEHVDTYNIEN